MTAGELKRLKNEAPELAGGRYSVIDHSDVVRCIGQAIEKKGGKVGELFAATTQDEAEAILTVGIKGTDNWVGAVNSNSRRRSSTMYAGVKVEGMFITLAKGDSYKHATWNPLARLVSFAGKLARMTKGFKASVARLKGAKVNPDVGDWLVMEAVRRKVIVPRRMAAIDHARANPPGKELAEPTALSLLYAVSSGLRCGPLISANPQADHLSQMYAFRQMIDERLA